VDSVVHFGQALPQRELRRSFDHAQRSDLFVVLGSSLTVTPAADLPLAAHRSGSYLVIVNQQQTPLDSLARLRFSEPINEVLPEAVKLVKHLMGHSD
jgi:NAD-dependent SIR2 family protein deacetylase